MSKIVVYDPGAAVVDAVIEYNPSANTPDYDSEPNKLVNPDLSLLEGIVPVLYWKRVGSTVVEMNQTEKETIDPQVAEERLLNEGAYDPPTENAGWEVDRAAEPNASLMWNETSNQWEFGTIGDIRPLGSVNVSDEGVDQGFATVLNFVGTGVTAGVAGGTATITISGGGDVSGPGSSTDNALVRWNGTGGDTIQDNNEWILEDDGFMDVTVNRTGHALSIRQNNAVDGEFISMVNSAGLDVVQFNKNSSEDGIWRVRMGISGQSYFEADFGVVKIGETVNPPNASYTLLVDHGNIGISNTSDQIVGIDVPTSGVTPWTLTLPPSSGNANEFLQTDGSGNAIWAPVATGGASVQLIWKFDDSTSASDPGSGFFRLNNSNPALATSIYINKDTETGPDASTLLNSLSEGDSVYFQQEEDGSRYILATISSNTDNGSWHTLALSAVGDSGTLFEDGKECIGILLYSGDGNVDAAANLTNNSVIRGDGGGKGIQDSVWSISDAGLLSTAGGGASITATGGGTQLLLDSTTASTSWDIRAGRSGFFDNWLLFKNEGEAESFSFAVTNSGQFRGKKGSAGAPTYSFYSFGGDPDSSNYGMSWQASPKKLNLSTEGLARLSIDEDGRVDILGSKASDYILSVTNQANPGNGFSVTAGESLGDIAFHIADLDDTFQIMEMEADQGYVTMGKTYAQTLTDNGIVYGLDIQHPSGNATDFNTQAGTYRIAGVNVIPPTGGTAGQVLEKIDGTDYNWQWGDVSLPDNPTIGGDEKLTLPTGTTAQRPGSPVGGDIRYNTTDGKFEGYENGAWIRFRQEDVVLARYTFFADQVEYPVTTSDWNVTVGAPAASDSNNSSLTVRLFDDTVTEAIGMIAKVPENASTLTVRTKTRAETGANQDVAFQLHRRVIPDNGAIGGWNVSTLTIVDVTSDERWQLDESTNTLVNWNIGAGDTVQFMLARNPGLGADTLTGDAALLFVELEFK